MAGLVVLGVPWTRENLPRRPLKSHQVPALLEHLVDEHEAADHVALAGDDGAQRVAYNLHLRNLLQPKQESQTTVRAALGTGRSKGGSNGEVHANMSLIFAI